MSAKKPFRAKSPAEVRAEFERQGVTVAAYCRRHGLNQHTVYQLLSGQKKGRWGQAHRAAVLLGMKEGVITSPEAQGA